MDQPALTATYISSTNASFMALQTITSPADSTTVANKTAYLRELHQAVLSVQDRVNRELTARMEEDNAKTAQEGENKGKKGVDDAKEEENYGEEMQEEED